MPLDPSRVVARLEELRSLTGDADGRAARRWTETWAKGRAWLAESLADLPLEIERDAAGNDWYTLSGDSGRAVLIGGHMDSVPNGGWLDGCLNVLAGAEVLRRIAEDGTPPVTVRLVDWADEEGARFGRSLFGSSAAAGSMADQDELRNSRPDGISLPDVIGVFGIDLDRALDARSQLAAPPRTSNSTSSRARCSSDGEPAGGGARDLRRRAVAHHLEGPGGTRGFDTDGQAARRRRRWREARASEATSPSRRETSRRRGRGHETPGIVTRSRARREVLDQRHLNADKLAAMVARSQAVARVRRGGGDRRRMGEEWRSSRSPSTRADRLADEAVRERPGRPPDAAGRCTTPPRSPAPACRQ